MQNVEADVGEGVAEVAGVVRRDAADVEADRTVADRREWMKPAAAGVVEAQGHAANSKAAPGTARLAGFAGLESADDRLRGICCRHPHDRSRLMEVLRWLLFFALAMFLIVAGIFFVMGRGLPLPRF